MSTDGKSAAQPGQYLTFLLKGQTFGVPIETVREINRVTDIAPVPKTHPCVAGVMNLRGKVIPVIDLRTMLGMPAAAHTKETCVVVIESREGQIGATVDAVAAVIDFRAENIEPTPRMGDGNSMKFVIGMGKAESGVVILIDAAFALDSTNLGNVYDVASLAA